MRWRLRSVRTRILLLTIVPAVSLLAVYAFATSISIGQAISLARATTIKNATGEPTGAFMAQIGAERMLAVLYLAAPAGPDQTRLDRQQASTDVATRELRAALGSPAAMTSASPAEKRAIAVLLAGAAGLPSLRSQIAARTITGAGAFAAYNSLMADASQVLQAAAREQASAAVATQALAFLQMAASQDLLLQEDTLLTADLASGRVTAAGLQAFTELVGARRAAYRQALPTLDPPYRAYYTRDVSAQALTALAALEDSVIRGTRPGGRLTVNLGTWRQTSGEVAAGLAAAGTQSGNELTRWAAGQARHTYLRLAVAGGLGLLAVVVSISGAVLMGRRQVAELGQLRQSALELASSRLPDVVTRLAAGEPVAVPAPPLPHRRSSAEIRQVHEAFAAVQQTAIEAATGQARLRHGINDVFLKLARRSQSLLHRQLNLLDAMERRATDATELGDLFRVDHLATRMRRHAENLIILSGAPLARGWRQPVPLVDVLRAAIAEVEDYPRIRVTAPTRASLTGPAASDVIHMIAELAENATIFSPPDTPVSITGTVVGQGVAVEIEDQGLGMSSVFREEINARLANPPGFDLSSGDQLGIFVAGRLAQRHDIRVTLHASPSGGTTAIVLIPAALVMSEGAPPGGPAVPAASVGGPEPAPPVPDRPVTAGGARAADPDPPLARTVPASPAGRVPAGAPAGHGSDDGDLDPDAPDLPRRVRQASLAPQLRDSPARPAPVTGLSSLGARSPEDTRSTMSAIQRGWERGRSVFTPAAQAGGETSPDPPGGGAAAAGQSAADRAAHNGAAPAADRTAPDQPAAGAPGGDDQPGRSRG